MPEVPRELLRHSVMVQSGPIGVRRSAHQVHGHLFFELTAVLFCKKSGSRYALKVVKQPILRKFLLRFETWHSRCTRLRLAWPFGQKLLWQDGALLKSHPTLTLEGIQAAMDYAAKVLRSEVVYPIETD